MLGATARSEGVTVEPRIEARSAAMGLHERLCLVAAGLATVVIVNDAWPALERSAEPAVSTTTDPVPVTARLHLTTEGPSVEEIIGVVRSQARQMPGAQPDAPLTVVLTSDVAGETGDERDLLAGIQRGETAWVRTDGGWPERTLVHEVAHVLTDGDGHGAIWRGVYLGAIEELFGDARASREQRRIAWIYDRCYLDGSCPRRDDSRRETAPQTSGTSVSAHRHPRGTTPWQRSR